MVEEAEPESRIISVDRERCIGYYECIDTCPQSGNTEFPVYKKSEEGFPRIVNPDSCIGCLSCEANCRALAVKVEGVSEKGPAVAGEARAESKCRAMF